MPDHRSPRGYLLAFDFGLKRIGVAVGQTLTGQARPLVTLAAARGPDWAGLERVVDEWRPALLIVGLPLDTEGGETDMSKAARAFGADLARRTGVDVDFFDERLSSHQAEGRFAELRAAGALRRKDADQVDALAAQIILENWLQSRPDD